MSIKSREYTFDKELYMHGACQYFAIQAAELYGGRVCLWLDTDYMMYEEGPTKVLCHAYTKIANGLYIDAYGPFSDIEYREDEFEFNEKDIIECSVTEAKQILKDLNVPITNPEMKRNAREFLRNNMLTFDIIYQNVKYRVGLIGKTTLGRGIDYMLFHQYNANDSTFGKMVHKLTLNEFVSGIIRCFGFQRNDGWYYKR